MQLTINWFKLFVILCKKYYRLILSILISLTIIRAQAITDTSIDGIITEIYDDTEFYLIDGQSKSISLGMYPTSGAVVRGTIYATKTDEVDPAVVAIKAKKQGHINSIAIGGKLDGTKAKNNNIMRMSSLLIAATDSSSNNELTIDNINIEDKGILLSAGLPGVKGGAACIKIKQPVTIPMLTNRGVLENKIIGYDKNIESSAISILGAANLLDGNIINRHIIKSSSYAILSVLYNKDDSSSDRHFNFVNMPEAKVIGSIKLCGDNCRITNGGNIGQDGATVTDTNSSFVFDFATVTVNNTSTLCLVAIDSNKSYSHLTNSGFFLVLQDAKLTKLDNLPDASAKILGKLDLTNQSSNSGTMRIKHLTTATTFNNNGDMIVDQLDNCNINNQATLTVLTAIKNKVDIAGELQLKGTVNQQGNAKIRSISGASATLINSGSLSITDNSRVTQIINRNLFFANNMQVDFHTATSTYKFSNNIGAKATVNNIKNISIKNDSEFLVLQTIEGTVEVEGKITIGSINITEPSSTLNASYLAGQELNNHGHVQIANDTKLDTLHNRLGSMFTNKKSLHLIKYSQNSGKLHIGKLTTATDLGQELHNNTAGEITCASIYNAFITNKGIIKITQDIGGEVSIISQDQGNLSLEGNIINAANLFIDSKITTNTVIFTNRGSVTITKGIDIDQLFNNNHLTIADTLTIAKSSINNGNLIINCLKNSARITNNANGKIIVDHIENSIINNISINNDSLLVKYSIKGNVKINGNIKSVGTLTQEGSLDTSILIGDSFNVAGKIQAKSMQLKNLVNYTTGEITITDELVVKEATNDGVITTYKLINNGVFYNKGKLNIGYTDFFVKEGGLINNGFIGCKGTFIITGTMTNNGTLELCALKGIKKYTIIEGSNNNAKLGFSRLVTGNFIIKQDSYLTGDATISGYLSDLDALLQVTQSVKPIATNTMVRAKTSTIQENFIIKSLAGEKFNLAIMSKNKVQILNDANIGAINNLGHTIINNNLFLHAATESTNNSWLSAKAFYSVATLTNTASATLKFETIKQAIIISKAPRARLEVSKTLDASSGKTYIYGTLDFTGDIQQSGSLYVEQIQGKDHLLKVSRSGNIIANTIILTALKNNGSITSGNLFLSNNSTNTGTIITDNLTCSKSLCNIDGTLSCDNICQAQEITGGKVIINNEIKGDTTIDSCVYINKQLKLLDNITVVADQLAIKENQDAKLIIGKQTTATIKQMLADKKLHIVNNGTIKLKGGSIFQSYLGNEQSQLYVNIPIRKLTEKDTPLLTVRGAFTCKTTTDIPAIIITADKPPPTSYLNTSFDFIVLSANKLYLEGTLTDLLAEQKVQSSSVLFHIDLNSPKITEEKQAIKLTVKGTWLDVENIDSIKQHPMSLRKMATLLQKLTRTQCKNAALLELDHYISQNKFRPESKELLNYLLSESSDHTGVNEHLRYIQNVFFINTSNFANDPVKLLRNLAEYSYYKKYLPNKPLTPLLPRNIYDLIEQVLVDDSDIINIANSENISSFLTSISNRLATQNKNNLTQKHKKTKILVEQYNTYGWSSFNRQETKNVANDGYMINNYTVNLVNLGVDRVFDKLHLGWMFGYADTRIKNLGTKVATSRNHTYDIKTNASAIYAKYNFDSTVANLVLIFGQSQQKENFIIIKEEFNSAFISNLIATMGEFIYSNNINKLYFDIASRFELQYIDTPQHSTNNKILVTKPTIQSNIKYRNVAHRINLGCALSLYYTMNLLNMADIKYLLSVSYVRNFNLRKDRLQELEFFKGLFNIQQQDYSKNNIFLNCLVQIYIQKALNVSLGVIASHKDYSKSLGITASLQYNF